MNDKIKSFEEVCELCHKMQRQGKKIVFVHGFFDILHAGHINFLSEAKRNGDCLVVGVDSDTNAELLKGKNRPINSQDLRAYVLNAIKYVDYTFHFESIVNKSDINCFYELYYTKLSPNIIVVRSSVDRHVAIKRRRAAKIGIQLVNLPPYNTHLSTTRTVKLLGFD